MKKLMYFIFVLFLNKMALIKPINILIDFVVLFIAKYL